MKKLITTATLIAAGAAFAGAATGTITVEPRYNADASAGYGVASYTGFEFRLDTSSLISENQNYTLDSFTVFATSANDTQNKLSTEDSLVVYEVTDTGLSYVTAAAVTSTSSLVLKGTDWESEPSHKYTLDIATTGFGDVKFNSSVEYAIFFAETATFSSQKSVFEEATEYSDISLNLITCRLSAGQEQPDTNISGGTMYTAAGEVAASYCAFVGATVTAVPEPSAFGLLAGLGALALVASRRRRK